MTVELQMLLQTNDTAGERGNSCKYAVFYRDAALRSKIPAKMHLFLPFQLNS